MSLDTNSRIYRSCSACFMARSVKYNLRANSRVWVAVAFFIGSPSIRLVHPFLVVLNLIMSKKASLKSLNLTLNQKPIRSPEILRLPFISKARHSSLTKRLKIPYEN